MAPGGERARVTSGVRDRRDVQSIVPDRVVDICLAFLLIRDSD